MKDFDRVEMALTFLVICFCLCVGSCTYSFVYKTVNEVMK